MPFALWAAEPPTYYVNVANLTPAAPYTSWATAATNIQQAIDTGTEPGRLVVVTNGVYRTGCVTNRGVNRVALPETVTVRSVNGPEVTVIEGAAAPGGGRGNGAIRCAYLGTNAVLGGFTLANGHTLAQGDWWQTEGGGALCETSAVLTNCVLTGNSAWYAGGARGGALYRCTLDGNEGNGSGAYLSTLHDCRLTRNSGPQGGGVHECTLYNCEVTANSAEEGGGAWGSQLRNCTLTANSAGKYPGLVGLWGSPGGGAYGGTLRNCILTANRAISGRGGGVYGSTLCNCTVTGNRAGGGGGASDATLDGCALTGNRAYWAGGAYGGTLFNCTVAWNDAESSAGGTCWSTLQNCIVWFNTATTEPYYLGYPEDGEIMYDHCCTSPLPPGPGNIDVDPRLVTASHLRPDSPCIGAGSAAAAAGTDLDGEPWADPPCIGADQVTPIHVTGPLQMWIQAAYTNVASGFAVRFAAQNSGPILASVWDIDDGLLVTNQPWVRHAWSTPGSAEHRFGQRLSSRGGHAWESALPRQQALTRFHGAPTRFGPARWDSLGFTGPGAIRSSADEHDIPARPVVGGAGAPPVD